LGLGTAAWRARRCDHRRCPGREAAETRVRLAQGQRLREQSDRGHAHGGRVATSPRRWRLCGDATSVVRTITAQAPLGVPETMATNVEDKHRALIVVLWLEFGLRRHDRMPTHRASPAASNARHECRWGVAGQRADLEFLAHHVDQRLQHCILPTIGVGPILYRSVRCWSHMQCPCCERDAPAERRSARNAAVRSPRELWLEGTNFGRTAVRN
jgi:hypothetical protein